jgi:hypothetical protein
METPHVVSYEFGSPISRRSRGHETPLMYDVRFTICESTQRSEVGDRRATQKWGKQKLEGKKLTCFTRFWQGHKQPA